MRGLGMWQAESHCVAGGPLFHIAACSEAINCSPKPNQPHQTALQPANQPASQPAPPAGLCLPPACRARWLRPQRRAPPPRSAAHRTAGPAAPPWGQQNMGARQAMRASAWRTVTMQGSGLPPLLTTLHVVRTHTSVQMLACELPCTQLLPQRTAAAWMPPPRGCDSPWRSHQSESHPGCTAEGGQGRREQAH